MPYDLRKLSLRRLSERCWGLERVLFSVPRLAMLVWERLLAPAVASSSARRDPFKCATTPHICNACMPRGIKSRGHHQDPGPALCRHPQARHRPLVLGRHLPRPCHHRAEADTGALPKTPSSPDGGSCLLPDSPSSPLLYLTTSTPALRRDRGRPPLPLRRLQAQALGVCDRHPGQWPAQATEDAQTVEGHLWYVRASAPRRWSKCPDIALARLGHFRKKRAPRSNSTARMTKMLQSPLRPTTSAPTVK